MNEHDKLFRKVESIKENAIDLIEATFPADVLNILDVQTMLLDNTSYISKNLKEYYSDLVYTCTTKNDLPVKISILFEHKSYKPDNEYIQLFRYMLNIWEYQIKNKQPITPVIPVIFYHDTVEWIQKDFAEYFNITKDSSLRQFIPAFNYILTDLHKYDDEVIKKKLFKRDFNKALALLFKHFKNEKQLLEHLYDIFKVLEDYIRDTDKHEKIMEFIIYIMKISEIPEKKLIDVMNTVSENGGNTIMTTYMKIRKEGKLEGKLEGKREDALKMLKKGFSIEDITDITGLSIEEIKSIRNNL